MALSDAACRAAKSSGQLRKLSDGGGLQLWVQPTGSRLWRFAYRFEGKQKLLALGLYPLMSLAEARDARDLAKKQLSQGLDPGDQKKESKRRSKIPPDTFRSVGAEYLAKLRREQRAPATMVKKEWLLSLAAPALGAKRVSDIRPVDVLAAVQAVEIKGCYETARRLRSTIGAVCRFAIATARAEIDPTAALRGALTVPVVKPRAAITKPEQFGALLRAIDGFQGQPTTGAALKLMALLFPRPGELRAATWDEFDFRKRVWTIPAARTKMRREHKVFLADQALVVLKELLAVTGGGLLLFPGLAKSATPISENTLNGALRRLGYGSDEMTSHGFRASASTLLNESGKWSADAIERQLGHVEASATRRAYARGDHWDERVRMMAWWADYLDRVKAGGTVVRFSRARSSRAIV